MKFRICFFVFFLLISNSCFANSIQLERKSISLKDFIILKTELFMNENIKNVFLGGGVFLVAYQNIHYKVNIDENDKISIFVDAVMDKKRYRSKKYYPKLKDCSQVRNKIFMNKYGYSFLRQRFNNLVNEENLEDALNQGIFNISSLDKEIKKKLIKNMEININVIHPKSEKSLSCGGKITDSELFIK